jgi:NAD(P)-dependent dehydrogenase (short-subunit alcohol dehydrogenase family)
MKTIIVTGANSGLGFLTAKYLLELNYRVIMACRNIAKTNIAIAESHEFKNTKNCVIKQLDLGDFTSIENFVDSLPANEPIYGLDCNAGIVHDGPFHYTKNGIEDTFGVNHIGHFYLTDLLLKKFDIPKIVVISSELHNPANKSPMAKAVYKNVHENAYPKIDPNSSLKKQNQEFYANSKLCNVLFTYVLDRKLKGKTIVNAFNPGFMPSTNFGKTEKIMNRFLSKLLYIVGGIFGFTTSPEKSAKNVIHLLTQETRSGQYFDKDKSIKSSVDSYDKTKAQELWSGSETLINSILKHKNEVVEINN